VPYCNILDAIPDRDEGRGPQAPPEIPRMWSWRVSGNVQPTQLTRRRQWLVGGNQSGLMPASLMIGHHFSISAFW
jgi:hypothetical protein